MKIFLNKEQITQGVLKDKSIVSLGDYDLVISISTESPPEHKETNNKKEELVAIENDSLEVEQVESESDEEAEVVHELESLENESEEEA